MKCCFSKPSGSHRKSLSSRWRRIAHSWNLLNALFIRQLKAPRQKKEQTQSERTGAPHRSNAELAWIRSRGFGQERRKVVDVSVSGEFSAGGGRNEPAEIEKINNCSVLTAYRFSEKKS